MSSSEQQPQNQTEGAVTKPTMRAAQLLRVPAIWLSPLVIASVLIFLITLFYVGSVVNPVGHLNGLPVALANEDQGATVLGRNVDIGAEVASALQHSPAVSSRLSLDAVPIATAEQRMRTNSVYATIVIPPGFTQSLLAAYGLTSSTGSSSRAGKPTVRLLTNPRAGSIGVELATGVSQPALSAVSLRLGRELSAQAVTFGRTPAAGFSVHNPLTIVSTDYDPLPPNSALGLSAFYVALLSIMCGFLGGILVNTTVDAALGYGITEIGPKWRQRMPVPISRWQTLLSKWVVALVLVPILTAILLLVSVGLLHMNAPYVWELWLFTSFAAVTIAAGTLALLAAFGALGQMIALLVFIYLALASSGGTIPLQALPTGLRFVAFFEPLRQVLDGVRAILYFGAAGSAGLTRGLVLTAIGLVFWFVVGVAVTIWYDRQGLDRLPAALLDYVQRSARAYPGGTGGAGREQVPAPPEAAGETPESSQ